jgi:hypothetical protein
MEVIFIMNEFQKSYVLIFTSLLSIILLACSLHLMNEVSVLNQKVDKLIEYQQTTQVPDDLTLAVSGEITIAGLEEVIVTEEDEVVEEIEINDDPTLAKSRYADTIDGLTDYEKDLICRIAFREAGNQSEEGKRAVIEVILNRLNSDVWPNTVEGVLSQSHQFSTWRGRANVSAENVASIQPILDKVGTEEPVLSEDYVYFNSLSNPRMNNRVKIQDHWFGTGNS